MRAFVALEMPMRVRQQLARRIDAVRALLPPARWVRPAAYHLTLQFLGEIATDVAAEVSDQLVGAYSRQDAFSVKLTDGGTFPADRPARVVWVGVEEPTPVLEAASIARTTCGPVVDCGPERTFRPHLTVARCRKVWPRAAVETWRREMRGVLADSFEVSSAVLMRSHLGPGGARYEVVSRYPLSTGGCD